MTASNTPLLAEYGSVSREYATRTRVYSTRWYILALFSLLGLLQVSQKWLWKDDATFKLISTSLNYMYV